MSAYKANAIALRNLPARLFREGRPAAGDFDREEDALAFLATELAAGGPESIADYGLSREPDPDNTNPVWSGDELAKRVRAYARGENASSLRHTA